MAIFRKGYDNRPLSIKVNKADGDTHWNRADIWIEIADTKKTYKETLSFASVDELVVFRDEINKAIKDMVGL